MTNTIPNVPRELLERVKSLCEYWFVRGQQQHMSESEHKTWHALGFGSSAFTELRALLSAPSPDGVDGLEVVGHIGSDDDVSGSYAVFKNDCDLRDGTELVRLSDAAAIIDGLRGEVERLQRAEKNDAIAYKAALERQDELRAELAALKAQGVVLTDEELCSIRNQVACNEVRLDDDSRTICVKHGRALEAAVLARLNASPAAPAAGAGVNDHD